MTTTHKEASSPISGEGRGPFSYHRAIFTMSHSQQKCTRHKKKQEKKVHAEKLVVNIPQESKTVDLQDKDFMSYICSGS